MVWVVLVLIISPRSELQKRQYFLGFWFFFVGFFGSEIDKFLDDSDLFKIKLTDNWSKFPGNGNLSGKDFPIFCLGVTCHKWHLHATPEFDFLEGLRLSHTPKCCILFSHQNNGNWRDNLRMDNIWSSSYNQEKQPKWNTCWKSTCCLLEIEGQTEEMSPNFREFSENFREFCGIVAG